MSGKVEVVLRMPAPPVEPSKFDAGDVKSVKQRKTQGLTEQQRTNNDMLAVLALPEGRRLLYRLIGMCRTHQDPFNTNALTMARLTGEAAIGNRIIEEIAFADPKAYAQMQLEDLSNKEAANG